jgi:hypothetical protein
VLTEETLDDIGARLDIDLCIAFRSCIVSLPVTVMRMIKYTGYGNAAGFLARRGAMLGGSASSRPTSGAQYSSDSEDSDTEEYKKYQSQ